jgi:hypothetical protein
MKLVDNKVYLLMRHEYDFANAYLNVVDVYQDETEAELEALELNELRLKHEIDCVHYYVQSHTVKGS